MIPDIPDLIIVNDVQALLIFLATGFMLLTHIVLQDRHLFLRPVQHTNGVTHHIAAKDTCIPLAFFFDCQWINVNSSPWR